MNAADEGTKATGDDNVNWWRGNEQEVWCKSDMQMNHTNNWTENGNQRRRQQEKRSKQREKRPELKW